MYRKSSRIWMLPPVLTREPSSEREADDERIFRSIYTGVALAFVSSRNPSSKSHRVHRPARVQRLASLQVPQNLGLFWT